MMTMHSTLPRTLALSVTVVAGLASGQAQPKTIPAGYQVERIPTPKGVAFGVGGMCFTKDNALFACTREGDVWKLQPANAAGTWSRFARGLHEPLGIWVDPADGHVFVVQRPELTELIDRDRDGKADVYRTVSAAWGLTDNYHEYAFGLVRDTAGNFYGTLNTTLSWKGWAGSDKWDMARVHDSKMGRAAKYRGWSWRISPDGHFEPWSAGMRSPAGIGMSPAGELFYTDNQGDWVATSALHHIRKGRFHGHPSSLMDHPDYKDVDLNSISIERYGELRTPPAVNFPHGDLASSPGEPVWDETGGKFGPFAGQCFVGDQTRSNVLRVVLEEVDGQLQGCAINFVDHLQAGVVRSRFAPDGSLWCGQTGRGWGSRGPAQYGIERIVWDGKTAPFEIESMSLTTTGFVVRFTKALDEKSSADPKLFALERWRYKYQPQYGSKKFDKGPVPLQSVELSDDRRSASLTVDGSDALQTLWMYQLTCEVQSADGEKPTTKRAWYTLNRLRK